MPDEIDQIQLNLLDQDNSLNEIGCCSHYRECSDLGGCVTLVFLTLVRIARI